jgi:hypothetical protein
MEEVEEGRRIGCHKAMRVNVGERPGFRCDCTFSISFYFDTYHIHC